MAHLSVINAVTERVAANFTHCPVFGENSNEDTPADGSSFLQIQFPFSNTEWIEVEGPDGSVFREEGAFRFVLSVPRFSADATVTGRQWLGELAQLFTGVVFDGVQTFAPDSPVADDNNDDASYYRLSMAVAYHYHFVSAAA